MNSRKIGTIILAICTAIAVCLALFVAFNYQLSKDFISGLSYSPTPEVISVEKNLDLTVKGAFILHASKPKIETESDFNSNCVNYNPGVSTIGCHNNGVIHVYGIKNEELNGIIESTMAHELLHAVWIRLSDDEKSEIEPILYEIYEKNKEQLQVISNYEGQEKTNELFAHIGTEIKNLESDKLEQIYLRYFNKRDKLVNFYNSFSMVFNKLSNSIRGLKERMDELISSINSETEIYTTKTKQLSEKIDIFNTCADQEGCFTSSDFVSQRAELLEEKNYLESLYTKITNETNEYNQKVVEYNKNILKAEYYTAIVNSNENY